MMERRAGVGLVAALLPLAGCVSAGPDVTPDGDWTVAAIGNAAITGDPPLTLSIGQGRYGGYAGCNRYGGPVTQTGGSIAFSPAAATRMVCSERGRMEREQALLDLVAAAQSWSIEGNRLLLSDGSGQVVLTLDRAP